MSRGIVNTYHQFVSNLQLSYPHLVIPAAEVGEVLQALNSIRSALKPEQFPELYLDTFYLQIKITHSTSSQIEKQELVDYFLGEIVQLPGNYPKYLFYARLMAVFFVDFDNYFSALFDVVKDISELTTFYPLVCDELITHITKISAFHYDTLQEYDSDSITTFFTNIYTYFDLTAAEVRLDYFDQMLLITLLQFEQRIQGSSPNLDQFLGRSRDLFTSVGEDIPSYFISPYQSV